MYMYCEDVFEYDDEKPEVWLLQQVCASIFVYIQMKYVYVL